MAIYILWWLLNIFSLTVWSSGCFYLSYVLIPVGMFGDNPRTTVAVFGGGYKV